MKTKMYRRAAATFNRRLNEVKKSLADKPSGLLDIQMSVDYAANFLAEALENGDDFDRHGTLFSHIHPYGYVDYVFRVNQKMEGLSFSMRVIPNNANV